jgi:hypothetical protein
VEDSDLEFVGSDWKVEDSDLKVEGSSLEVEDSVEKVEGSDLKAEGSDLEVKCSEDSEVENGFEPVRSASEVDGVSLMSALPMVVVGFALYGGLVSSTSSDVASEMAGNGAIGLINMDRLTCVTLVKGLGRGTLALQARHRLLTGGFIARGCGRRRGRILLPPDGLGSRCHDVVDGLHGV